MPKSKLTSKDWNTILDRFLNGEDLPQIHKDYAHLTTLGSLRVQATRQGWIQMKDVLKKKVQSLVKTENEIEQMAKKGLTATVEQITAAKNERIEITSTFIQMVKEYLKVRTYVWDDKMIPKHWRELHPGEDINQFQYTKESFPFYEPKDIAALGKALDTFFTIQRTEYGEASFISETRNLNVNLDVQGKKAKVEQMKQELLEYEHQKS